MMHSSSVIKVFFSIVKGLAVTALALVVCLLVGSQFFSFRRWSKTTVTVVDDSGEPVSEAEVVRRLRCKGFNPVCSASHQTVDTVSATTDSSGLAAFPSYVRYQFLSGGSCKKSFFAKKKGHSLDPMEWWKESFKSSPDKISLPQDKDFEGQPYLEIESDAEQAKIRLVNLAKWAQPELGVLLESNASSDTKVRALSVASALGPSVSDLSQVMIPMLQSPSNQERYWASKALEALTGRHHSFVNASMGSENFTGRIYRMRGSGDARLEQDLLKAIKGIRH